MRAVETTPTALPSPDRISAMVGTVLASTVAQSPRFTAGPTPMSPALVLMPVCMAVPVPAESGVCALVL